MKAFQIFTKLEFKNQVQNVFQHSEFKSDLMSCKAVLSSQQSLSTHRAKASVLALTLWTGPEPTRFLTLALTQTLTLNVYGTIKINVFLPNVNAGVNAVAKCD